MSTWLIVDDHPAICFAVKAILSPLGDNVIITATNGLVALAKIKECSPQLVILDIMLNKTDGLQILQHIRNIDSNIKVVVFTSLPAIDYAERVLRAGASGFFNKDQDISQLALLCKLVMQGYYCFPQGVILPLLSKSSNNDNVLTHLSDRELTVLRYLSKGFSNKQIADSLILSSKTISTYKTRLMGKLNVSSTEELISFLKNHSDNYDEE